MSGIKSFEDLVCWQEARALRNFVKDNITNKLPNSEKYELASQLKRSSRSVGNNIAEGFGRYHYQENIQFCRIARGSLSETLGHGIVALDEGCITEEALNMYKTIHNKTLKILNGYIKYLSDTKFKQQQE